MRRERRRAIGLKNSLEMKNPVFCVKKREIRIKMNGIIKNFLFK